MKRLYLVRHAKSSWSSPAADDWGRPLNKRGLQDAPEMAQRVARHEHPPSRILSSSAARAMATARAMAGALGIAEATIVSDDRLYLAGVDDMLAVVAGVSDAVDAIMLVGHNPGMTDAVGRLGRAVIDNVPTCGVAEITFDTDAWHAIGRVQGTLVDFDYPKR